MEIFHFSLSTLPNLSPDRIRPIPLIDLESISGIFSDECTPDCQPIVMEFKFPSVFIANVKKSSPSYRHNNDSIEIRVEFIEIKNLNSSLAYI